MPKLPVGLSDFKQLIEEQCYYVDKSLLLKELLDRGSSALLIPRPRRFGKTLNLSMLRYFFEKSETDNSRLFRGLKIWQAGAEYTAKQGKYPVIFLTFKDVKESNWQSALNKMKRLIQEEFLRHKYLRFGKGLEAEELGYFNGVAELTGDQSAYEDSLKNLCLYLARHHQQRVILLIDEYDTPIQAGYVNGYYAEIVGFMRNFLSGGLKDNSNLEKGVLTGIMRVAKESIFSGLNKLEVFTLLSQSFSDKFGLTDDEVKRLLEDTGLPEHYDEVRNWYNGYRFGGHVIYNPWSIINYASKSRDGFKPYWTNTSDNAIIEKLLTSGGQELKEELESLIRGESIAKPVQENIVFRDLERKESLLWSFLLFSGYLKYVTQWPDAFDPAKLMCRLVVPNQEVRGIYIGIVEQWFSERLAHRDLEMMLRALLEGDTETFEEGLSKLTANSFSVWDTGGRDPEKVYQAFVIGLLVWLAGRYEVKSNRESGFGRYDVLLIPRDPSASGIIIEFKKINTKRRETKDSAMTKAFQQIEEKNYAEELRQRGVQHVRKLAIVFKGKQVWVKEKNAAAPNEKRKR